MSRAWWGLYSVGRGKKRSLRPLQSSYVRFFFKIGSAGMLLVHSWTNRSQSPREQVQTSKCLRIPGGRPFYAFMTSTQMSILGPLYRPVGRSYAFLTCPNCAAFLRISDKYPNVNTRPTIKAAQQELRIFDMSKMRSSRASPSTLAPVSQ